MAHQQLDGAQVGTPSSRCVAKQCRRYADGASWNS
jgi:hypothetical protein